MDEELKDMCALVDSFMSRSWSEEFASSTAFWDDVMSNTNKAQLFTECLVFKFVAIKVGLGSENLYKNLGRIRRMSGHELFGSIAMDLKQDNSLSPAHGVETNKRKSFDKRKSSSTENIKGNSGRKRSQNSKSEDAKIISDVYSESEFESRAVLNTMNFMTSLSDLVKWDFNKLREVFLLWNKIRGWNQAAANKELSIMKRLSIAPSKSNISEKFPKYICDHFSSIPLSTQASDSLKYWKYRNDVLNTDKSTDHVIKEILKAMRENYVTSDTLKILPLLHTFAEVVIMSSHIPLELLEESYKVISMYYVWSQPISQEVEDLLTFLQMEMKCPGFMYRAILTQTLGYEHSMKDTNKFSETHILLDENLPESENIMTKLFSIQGKHSPLHDRDEMEILRFLVSHVYLSMFGHTCCDIQVINDILQTCNKEKAQKFCSEVLNYANNFAFQDSSIEKGRSALKKKLEDLSFQLTDDHLNKASEDDQSHHASSNHRFHFSNLQLHYFVDDLPLSLVTTCAQNEKEKLEANAKRKRDSTHLKFRDSGIADASDNEFNGISKSPIAGRHGMRHVSTPAKILESDISQEISSFAKLAQENDAEDYWKGFLENGFGESKIDMLLRSLSVTDEEATDNETSTITKASKEFSESIHHHEDETFHSLSPSKSNNKKVSRKNSKLSKISNFSKRIIHKKRISDRSRKEKGKSSPTVDESPTSSSGSTPTASISFDLEESPRWRTSSDPLKKNKDGSFRETSISFSTPTTRRRESVFSSSGRKLGSPMAKKVLVFPKENDGDSIRQRTDSGFGESAKIYCRRRRKNHVVEETEIAGVKIIRVHSARLRTTLAYPQKKVIRLLVIGNDDTFGNLSRSYLKIKSSVLGSLPLSHYVDVQLFYLPISACSKNKKECLIPAENPTVISDFIAASDSWYKKILMPTISNLFNMIPPRYGGTPKKKSTNPKVDSIRTPENILGNAIHSYLTFAHKDLFIDLYKAVIVTSTGDVKEELFCRSIEIGHSPYKKAVKAGRFGKLVDLSADSSSPPAYSKVIYTKQSLDNDVTKSTEREAVWYHTALIQPMALWKPNYNDSGSLVMSSLVHEKKSKSSRRSSNTKMLDGDKHEHVTSLQSIKFDVVKPSQATVVICIDNSIILTNVKSVEVSRYYTTSETSGTWRKSTSFDPVPFRIPIKTFSKINL